MRRRLFQARRVAGALGAAAAIALAQAPVASAQISFAAPILSPAGGESFEIVAGHWNGDLRIDVATANNQSDNASTMLGDRTGGFLAPTTHAVGGFPTDIGAADVGGDGNQDLAVATQNSTGMAVLIGSASGSFAAPTDVPVGPSPFQVALGDLNGDGRADIVAANNAPAGGNVTVTLANPVGGFGSPTAYDVSSPPADVAIGDLNRDNRPDVVTADRNSQTVSVLLGNGDGSFAAARSVSIGLQPSALAIDDFDHNLMPDVVVATQIAGVTVLLGDGNGGLGTPTQFGTNGRSALDVSTADFDTDLHTDLAVLGRGELVTLKGTGNGSFEAAVDQPSPGGDAGVVADVDGDAIPDLLVAAGQNVAVMPNISRGGGSGGGGPAPLPAPEVAKTANVTPVKGTVLVKQPGKRRFVRLTQGAQIRIGSLVNTTRGTVSLTTAANAVGATQSGSFRGGLFKLGQKRGARPIAELKLTAKLRCTRSRGPVRTGAKRARSRRLFGNARGSFRTRGRHSTATIRGTKWLVKDSCAGTLTVSQKGTVVVRDLVKRRTKILRTGQRYLARAR